MSWTDIVGLLGVVLILAAYAGATTGRLDPQRAPALTANFLGASAILLSLSRDFNLSAALVEGSWALVALFGLVRLAFRRPPSGPS